MSKPKSKSVFVCQQCGKESPKWLGRCPGCQEWNSFVETVVTVSTEATTWLASEEN
ncbi:MAG: DNA repair protein RadA, partial [Dehalococcoidia bacterium]|nr:DNA repair protein RadA [Dehalococcoidia bacterium]